MIAWNEKQVSKSCIIIIDQRSPIFLRVCHAWFGLVWKVLVVLNSCRTTIICCNEYFNRLSLCCTVLPKHIFKQIISIFQRSLFNNYTGEGSYLDSKMQISFHYLRYVPFSNFDRRPLCKKRKLRANHINRSYYFILISFWRNVVRQLWASLSVKRCCCLCSNYLLTTR